MHPTPPLARLACTLAALALLAGCSLESEPPPPRPAPTATAPPERPLEPAWYEDPDGDVRPTAIERELGTDPLADDCVKALDCPDVGPAGNLAERGQGTLLMLDSSGSMRGPAGADGKAKIEAAREALERYATGTPDRIELGFMVFGHEGTSAPADKARSCESAELAEPLGALDYRSFPATLERFDPRGYTPLATALERAAEAFRGREGDLNRVLLITDGVETCDGDPVAAARALKRAGVAVTVDVVGFDIAKSADAQALSQIAEATGGRYSDAGSGAELQRLLDAETQRQLDLLEASTCVLGQANEGYLCAVEYSNQAATRIGELSIAAFQAGDQARGQALTDLGPDMGLEVERRAQARSDEGERLSEQINGEVQESERRLRERYGPSANLRGGRAFTCLPRTFAPLGATAFAMAAAPTG